VAAVVVVVVIWMRGVLPIHASIITCMIVVLLWLLWVLMGMHHGLRFRCIRPWTTTANVGIDANFSILHTI
jgi:hypothetical protein